MNKVLPLRAFLIVGIFYLATAPLALAGMAVNESFELDDDSSGYPDDWAEWSALYSGSGGYATTYHVNDGMARTGSDCMDVSDDGYGFSYQDHEGVVVGKEYYLAAYFKDIQSGGSTGLAQLEIEYRDGPRGTGENKFYTENYQTAIPNDGQWHLVQMSYETPPDTELITITVGKGNGAASYLYDDVWFSDVSLTEGTANNPNPPDGAVNVMVEDVQLSWSAPVLVTDPEYSVYFGTDANSLPLHAEDLTATTIPVDVDTDTTYAWRVDVLDPNVGGNPTINEGPVWSFTTMPARPFILVQPQEAVVFSGETASFTIDAYSANYALLSYEWFKETEPGVILSDTDTLTITDAQLDDEEMYKCTLTNASGSVTSEPAGLFIKRVIGHWPFDDNLEDVEGGNHGTYTGGGSESYGTGVVPSLGSALLFDGLENRAITVPSIAVTSGSWSVAFWDFSLPDILNDGYMVASGSPDGWETMYMRRWEDSWIGGLNRYVGCVGLADPDEETAAETSFGYLGPYQRDTWHHHVMTYDPIAGVATWYIDGAMTGQYTGAQFTAFETEIYIGNRDSGGRAFEGLIDDLWLYNYPLDPIEVAVEYTKVTDGEVCMEYPEHDFNQDCRIDILDLEAILQQWLQCNRFPSDRCL